MNYIGGLSNIDDKNNDKMISDETLVHQAKLGNNNALEQLMVMYKPLVIKRARRFYLVGGDYDDLVQEGTIGLFKAIRGFDPYKKIPFATFATMCIQRQLCTAIEAAQRKKHTPLNESVSIDETLFGGDCNMSINVPSPEQILESKENARQLSNIIQSKLSTLEQIVIKLYLNGFNYKKIALLLHKNKKCIDNALQRARSKLKKALKSRI